jgi:hypothetical protein
MKKYNLNLSWLIFFIVIFSSCEKFLEEEPKTFLSPDFYFQSEAQINAAVNGLYTFLDDRFASDIGSGTNTYLFFEYLPGYGDRPFGGSNTNINQAINLNIKEDNSYVENIWETHYKAIENCNSIIENIEMATPEIIGEGAKNKLYGEVYFLRAYNYFNLVSAFGEVPLKLSSTKNLSDVVQELSSIEDVYSQIVKDLLTADSLMVDNTWASVEGRVARGTVKSQLAKVYLTMAGYPLQKGTEYYQKAYDQAKAVVGSSEFYLFDSYADLRDVSNENSGEYIWMMQRQSQYAVSPVHSNMLPYPEPTEPISAAGNRGGALAPSQAFFESYTAGDKRTEEKGFYYSKHASLNNPGNIIELGRNYIYKFWDDDAAQSGMSGSNYPLLTYADVLLTLAEAKVQIDGGTTNNMEAINAYFEVRIRANPDELKPSILSINDVLKERFWEICFEGHTWYDMLRTRKALNPTTNDIVNMIGYKTPAHPEGHEFKETDLLFPYPLREVRLNPNLTRN